MLVETFSVHKSAQNVYAVVILKAVKNDVRECGFNHVHLHMKSARAATFSGDSLVTACQRFEDAKQKKTKKKKQLTIQKKFLSEL